MAKYLPEPISESFVLWESRERMEEQAWMAILARHSRKPSRRYVSFHAEWAMSPWLQGKRNSENILRFRPSLRSDSFSDLEPVLYIVSEWVHEYMVDFRI